MNDQHFASLSPTLLARKGGAKPAMRSQLGMLGAAVPAGPLNEDDLGWNDLGDDTPASAQIFDFSSAQGRKAAAGSGAPDNLIVKAKRGGKPKGARASFTLRLDAERHLMLRLACTLHGCSAQQLVTDALDRLLGTMPDIQRLASQVARG